MKKSLKYMAVCLALLFSVMFGSVSVWAICTTYTGKNTGSNNYTSTASSMYSYLVGMEDGGLVRVQAGSSFEGILVEKYDSGHQLLSSSLVPRELPIFGGFYAASDAYYIITGQLNREESAETEVFRITKYDRNWNRLGAASLKDCNTTRPFAAGTVRMDMSGKYLLIRTCHEMYRAEDGYNHQANVTIQVDTTNMQITDSYTGSMNTRLGYVSHSFNQFIRMDGTRIAAVDHGDAYPRSVVLLLYQTDTSTGKFTPDYFESPCIAIDMLPIKGNTGVNYTGVSVGGFELSSNAYLAVGNSVVQDDDYDKHETRNIFVSVVDKTTRQVTTKWLTDYAEGDGTVSTPQMVKLGSDSFMVLWERNGEIFYTKIDGNGERVSGISRKEGSLSDCTPVVIRGKVSWYDWDNDDISFYEIDVQDHADIEVTKIHIGHNYLYTNTENSIAHFKCDKCETSKEFAVMDSFRLWWKTDETIASYSSYHSDTQEQGRNLYYLITNITSSASEDGFDSTMEVTSSDPNVVYPVPEEEYLEMRQPGTATVTFAPKYNPEKAKTITCHVVEPVKLEALRTSVPEVEIGETVILTADYKGGSEDVYARFSYLDESGKETVLADYRNTESFSWTPDFIGTVTLKVQIQDVGTNGWISSTTDNMQEAVLENFAVTKSAPPEISPKEIRYVTGVGGTGSENLAGILPKDSGAVSYQVTGSGDLSILTDYSVSADGVLNYEVGTDCEVGQKAELVVTISSERYKDAAFVLNLTIRDQIEVSQDSKAEVGFEGTDTIVYGQPLSVLKLNTQTAVFRDEEGKKVSGRLYFEEPEKLLTPMDHLAAWMFVPKKPEYRTLRGTLPVNVQKAVPKIAEAEIPVLPIYTYDPKRNLGELSAGKGFASVDIKGEKKNISGSWIFKETDMVPGAGEYNLTILFVPEDTALFERVEKTTKMTVIKAVPQIQVLPSAAAITYGESLKDSGLSGGVAVVEGSMVSGKYQWIDPELCPEVKDSNVSEFGVRFLPDDQKNYETVDFSMKVTVRKAARAPRIPAAEMTVSYQSSMVGDVPLPEGWSWETNQQTLLPVGEPMTADAVYEDQLNYEKYRAAVRIIRSECTHDHSEIINTKEPLCTEEGYTGDRRCTICGEIVEYGTAVPEKGHKGGIATCRERGKCEVCKAAYLELDPENHIHSKLENVRPATCTEEGYSGDLICTDCGAVLEYGVIVEAAGHKGGIATCTQRGSCEICGTEYLELNPENHANRKSSSKTTIKNGIKYVTTTVVCADCGEVLSQNKKSVVLLEKGKSYKSGNYYYKVTKVSKSSAEVAYAGCTRKTVTSITVGDTVKLKGITCKITAVAPKAFAKTPNVVKVTLGKNVTGIGSSAFYNCKKLREITIRSGSLKKVNAKAISGIYKKAVIRVPAKKVSAYKKLFTAKTGFLKTMQIKK